MPKFHFYYYFEILLAMKIMDYLKDKGPRKGSWKLGGWEAEDGSKVIERKGANMITRHLK